MDQEGKRRRVEIETECPMTSVPVENAFGQEVHTFLHCHLRGYDRTGEGIYKSSHHYDKYGAPVSLQDSWMEGYHSIEVELSKHFNRCVNTANDFPLVAAMAGGAHLYQPCEHDSEPWNWTGFVPLYQRWLCNGKFFPNRYFMTLRGNEIQNNLWDYHPHEEEEGEDEHDDEYVQISPKDLYRGGYWYKGNPWARYLHIVALKTHLKECLRYNYIVHPLAYRSALNELPDSNVDGIQWSIMNIAIEENFLTGNWGEKCHGMEVFNDFTYYYSWNPSYDIYGISIHNGEVMNLNSTMEECGEHQYLYWFDTYPLEYCEFLVDTALRRGVYLHILSANDAFYERATLPPRNSQAGDDEDGNNRLMADPKGRIIRRKKIESKPQNKLIHSTKLRAREKTARNNGKLKDSNVFLKTRPYGVDTVFGYTALIDTKQRLKDTVCGKDGCINKGELMMIDYLRDGQFFSHTGVYDLFDYGDLTGQTIPFLIQNQPRKEMICYEISGNMQLVFDFPPIKDNKTHLVWKYQMEAYTNDKKSLEITHGFFKLDDNKHTRLDLSNNNKDNVKFIRFSAFHPDNPMKRAWFNPIRGPAFGSPQCNKTPPPIKTKIAHVDSNDVMKPNYKMEYLKEIGYLEPIAYKTNDLNAYFDKCSERQELDMYCYIMEVCANQQNTNLPNTKTSSHTPPPRILEYVHGYFSLNDDFPTRLNLGNSWDASTLLDNTIYFFAIDWENGRPIQCTPEPKQFL